jgi:hypothetical protein
MFEAKNLGLMDAAIANEWAKLLDDGQPKPKLADSIRRGLGRVLGRGEVASPQPDEQTSVPAGQEPLKNWL